MHYPVGPTQNVLMIHETRFLHLGYGCQVIMKILKPSSCHVLMLSTVQRKTARKFHVDFLYAAVGPNSFAALRRPNIRLTVLQMSLWTTESHLNINMSRWFPANLNSLYHLESITFSIGKAWPEWMRNDAVLLPTPASALSSRLHVAQDVRRLRNVHASLYHLLAFLLTFCLQQKVER